MESQKVHIEADFDAVIIVVSQVSVPMIMLDRDWFRLREKDKTEMQLLQHYCLSVSYKNNKKKLRWTLWTGKLFLPHLNEMR